MSSTNDGTLAEVHETSTDTVTGRLFGGGHLHRLAWIGSSLITFLLFMNTPATFERFRVSLYQAVLSQGIGFGVVAGLTYIPSVAAFAQYFSSPYERAVAMAIVTMGSTLGSLVHPIVLDNLFFRSTGSTSFSGVGMIVCLLLIALPFMCTKYPSTPETSRDAKAVKKNIKNFFEDPVHVWSITGMVLVIIGVFFFNFYIHLKGIFQGLDATNIFNIFMILNVTSIVGRILPKFLEKELGLSSPIVILAVGCASLICALNGLEGCVEPFAILFGLFSGGFVSLLPPLLERQEDLPAEIGARLGIAFSYIFLMGLMPKVGVLYIRDVGILWTPTVFSGGLCAAGALFFLNARYEMGQRK